MKKFVAVLMLFVAGCQSGPPKPNPRIVGVVTEILPLSNGSEIRTPILIKFDDGRAVNLNTHRLYVVTFQFGKEQEIEYDYANDIIAIHHSGEKK